MYTMLIGVNEGRYTRIVQKSSKLDAIVVHDESFKAVFHSRKKYAREDGISSTLKTHAEDVNEK